MATDARMVPRGNALVTGAGRRIGRAIAGSLASDGWTVGIHCRNSVDEAEAARAEIVRRGGNAYVVVADISDEGEGRRLLELAAEEAGPVTCLVNNASVFERDDVPTVTRESWDLHMDANLRAPFFLAQTMAANLPPRLEGNVVNILDQRVINMTPGFVSYTVSKAGLWALTRSMALTLAPRIRVNAVAPGPTLPSPRQSAAQFRRQTLRTPLGRGATPEEIADGVRFVLSAPSMTGQIIALDGGQHLGWDFPLAGAPPIEE